MREANRINEEAAEQFARNLDTYVRALADAERERDQLREAAVNREHHYYRRCVELERERDEARAEVERLRSTTNKGSLP